MNVQGQPKIIKYCAFCKNHKSGLVPEKGHKGNCKWRKPDHDSMSCLYCIRAMKKILNTQNWRAKKNAKPPIKVENVSESVTELTDQMNDDCMDFKDIVLDVDEPLIADSDFFTQVDNLKDISVSDGCIDFNMEEFLVIGFKMSIAPIDYPRMIFKEAELHELEKFIMNAKKQSLHLYNPEFLYFKHEDGRLIVSCMNQDTLKWLNQEMKEFKFYDQIKIVLDKEISQSIDLVCLLDKPIKFEEFLMTAAARNSLNTRKWKLDRIIESSLGMQFFFAVDPISFQFIKILDNFITLKDQVVKVEVIEKCSDVNHIEM